MLYFVTRYRLPLGLIYLKYHAWSSARYAIIIIIMYGYYCTTSENKIHYVIQLLAPYNKVLWPGSASAPYTVNLTIYVVYIQWPLALKRFIPYYSVWVIRNGPQIGRFSGMHFDSAHLVFSPWVGIFCRVCKNAAAPVINQVEVRNWCWFNARPTSLTLSRHWPSNGLALYPGRFCRCPVFFVGACILSSRQATLRASIFTAYICPFCVVITFPLPTRTPRRWPTAGATSVTSLQHI